MNCNYHELIFCFDFTFLAEATPIDPCVPSPCGPNSQCRELNDHAVCSCLSSYIGTPPSCRPECVVSSECSQNKACVNQKCSDPCIGTCGLNTRCQVVNHNPICSCSPGYTGDPFASCNKIQRKNCIVNVWYFLLENLLHFFILLHEKYDICYFLYYCLKLCCMFFFFSFSHFSHNHSFTTYSPLLSVTLWTPLSM